MDRTQENIEAWVRAKLGILNAGYIWTPADVTEDIDTVQREVSEVCELIETCEHWKTDTSSADNGKYLIEDAPTEFVETLTVGHPKKNSPVFWDGEPIEVLHVNDLEALYETYGTSTGTPQYAAIKKIGTYRYLLLLPKPNVTQGDGTMRGDTADPVRLEYYRLPKSIAATAGNLEVSADLHDLVRLGVLVEAAERVGHENLAVWREKYDRKLMMKRKPKGIKHQQAPEVNNFWADAEIENY